MTYGRHTPPTAQLRLVLTKESMLNVREMDEARAEALLVEERSYYYGRTTEPPRRRQE